MVNTEGFMMEYTPENQRLAHEKKWLESNPFLLGPSLFKMISPSRRFYNEG